MIKILRVIIGRTENYRIIQDGFTLWLETEKRQGEKRKERISRAYYEMIVSRDRDRKRKALGA